MNVQTVLVVAGIFFIFFAIIGTIIIPEIGIGPNITQLTRFALGIVGIILFIIGYLENKYYTTTTKNMIGGIGVIAGIILLLIFIDRTPPVCGNGVCGTDENWITCPDDCGGPNITITEPKDGVTVYVSPVRVTGMVKNFKSDDGSLWVCVKSYDGIWYPQETLTLFGEDTWEADTNPGFLINNSSDIGKEFRIVVLVATNEADEELRKPLNGEGDAARGGGLNSLPRGVKIHDKITVIRGKK
ncbi:hypothetical protein BEH94_06065 [Candidatus Altiarchaeales archaeon WOR_SM1_SCG]|nr:hypothetical protein BEH94_06065 [Candidatus Altiarchaeales archaeon WOR_SM1_SCG]